MGPASLTGLMGGCELTWVLEGLPLYLERQLCEVCLKPEAPGTEPFFLAL